MTRAAIARQQNEPRNSRYASDLTDAEWPLIEPLCLHPATLWLMHLVDGRSRGSILQAFKAEKAHQRS